MTKKNIAKINLLSLFALLIFFNACNRKILNQPDHLVIFPAPPDTTRIQFLTSFSNSEEVEGKRNSFSKFILGTPEVLPINKPYGIAINDGKIYICDNFIKGLEIVNLEKHTFNYFIPDGKGQLQAPINCFVDSSGVLYVADIGRKQIVTFNQTGKYQTSFGDTGNYRPCDVFVNDNKIWVADLKGQKIKVYSKEAGNKLLFSFPNEESDVILYQPTNLYVTDNRVYVSDFGDFKIKIFDKEGNFIESVGSYGKSLGQFTRPKGIAVDKNLNLYVVDAGFQNVQIFNKENKLLMFFGGSYQGHGYMYLPAKVVIDYQNLKYFEKYVDPEYKLLYLVIVTNQYGPDKINIYGRVEPKK